jgi:energy-coupling factor transporter transmembrane protein EcfT
MEASLGILCISALLMGVMHTAMGPDHYLPFIAISKAREWSMKKTLGITLICGIAHVFSSVLIGLFGIGCGIALEALEMAEALRGNLAAWLLVGCGMVYMVWGIFHGLMNREHHHVDAKGGNLTPWALFVIFVFGPCEPLIPVLMFPAATIGLYAALLVALIFALATLLTMTGMVIGILYGLHFSHSKSHRFAHALAGAVMLLCGLAIHLGL